MEDCNVGCSEFLAQKTFGIASEEDRHNLTFHTCNIVLYCTSKCRQCKSGVHTKSHFSALLSESISCFESFPVRREEGLKSLYNI